VPRSLADRVVALAEANRDSREESLALGPLLVEAKLVGRREEGRPLPPWPAATLGDEAKRELARWAESAGPEVDPVTRWPKRVRRRVDGAEMILVPRGPCEIGGEPVPDDWYPRGYRNGPRRSVELTRSYYLDASEVTRAQWKRFALATGRSFRAKAPSDNDALPMAEVTHDEALAYAAWAGCALPTEAQWERAARAAERHAEYPTDRNHDRAKDRNGAGSEDGFPERSPVRSFAPNSWGFFDMSGNVAEWCADGFRPRTESREVEKDPIVAPGQGPFVVKGGSWKDASLELTIGARREGGRELRGSDVGFRCARTLP